MPCVWDQVWVTEQANVQVSGRCEDMTKVSVTQQGSKASFNHEARVALDGALYDRRRLCRTKIVEAMYDCRVARLQTESFLAKVRGTPGRLGLLFSRQA